MNWGMWKRCKSCDLGSDLEEVALNDGCCPECGAPDDRFDHRAPSTPVDEQQETPVDEKQGELFNGAFKN